MRAAWRKSAGVRDVVKHPLHPYAKGLMGAIPTLDVEAERLTQIPGSMPRLTRIPPGCAFNPRCERVFDRCRLEKPEPSNGCRDLRAREPDAGASRCLPPLHAQGPGARHEEPSSRSVTSSASSMSRVPGSIACSKTCPRPISRPWTGVSVDISARARPSRWWANPVRANRPWRAWPWACCR